LRTVTNTFGDIHVTVPPGTSKGDAIDIVYEAINRKSAMGEKLIDRVAERVRGRV
jgi:hypothetical protein